MKMKIAIAVAAIIAASASAALADYVYRDGDGGRKFIKSGTLTGGVIQPYQTPVDASGIPIGVANPLAIQFGTGILLPSFGTPQHFICDSGCSGGSGGGGSVFGPTPVGTAAANPPVQIGGTIDGTATGAISAWKVAAGIGFINCANCSGSGISVAFASSIGTVGTPGGFKDGSGNFQPLLGGNTNGQWVEIKAAVPLSITGSVAVTGTFFQATQPVSAASLPLPALASTSTKQSDGTQKTQVVDGSGNVIASTANALNVNIASGNITGFATQTTLASIDTKTPALGQALAAGSVPVVLTAAQLSTLTPLSSVTVTQGTGTNLHIVCDSGCSGSGGTSSAFGSAFPAAGTAVGMTQGGNMVAFSGTAGNLNVQCANCSGSGASAVDEASVTFGTSVFAPMGGAYQTTATSNPLVSGQQGLAQLTINRALHVNLRNAVGVTMGDATTPLQVSLANTAANGTALLVTGTGGSFPVTGTVTANAGTNLNTSLLALETGGNLATIVTNTGRIPTQGQALAAASLPVVLTAAQITTLTPLSTVAVTQSGSWSLAANQSINVAQINGVTPLMGNGVTGTGSQRVTIASDNTAFTVNAAQSGTWNITNISGTISLPSLASTSTKQSDGSQKTQIVDGSGNVIASTSNNLNVQCANCSGSGVSAADAATFTAGTSLFAPVGGQFTSGGATACVTGHECTVGMTAARAIFTDMASIAGTTTLTGNGTAGAGAQRVTIASDNTAFSVNATLSAETTKVIGTARIIGNGGATMDVAIGGATAPTNALVGGGVYVSSPITLTTGQASALQLDPSGNLKVIGTGIATGSTTSGQTGSLVMAATTTAAPTYTTAQSNPLSLDTAGSLRVNCTTGCSTSTAQQGPLAAGTATATNSGIVGGQFLTTQPTMTNTQQAAILFSSRGELLVAPGVSGFAVTLASTTVTGTVAVTQSGSWSLSANQSVNMAQINGVTPLMGNGVTGTGSQRVTIASDNTAFAVNPASATAPVSTMNSASSAAGVTSANAYVFDDVSPTAITENNFGYGRMSANRNQYQTIRDAAGNERGANVSAGNALLVDASATTQPVSNAGTFAVQATIASPAGWGVGTSTQNSASIANGTLILGQFNTSPTPITTGNMSPLQMDNSGKLLVNCTGCSSSGAITTWGGTTLGAGSNYGTSPGAVAVNGVNAFVTNTVAVTLTSTTITGSVAITAASTTLADITALSTPVAANTATATKAILLGGQFDTTQKTLTNGQQAALSVSARGAAFVATGADTFNVTVNAALPAGTNLMGKVGIDQTTPGTTNAIRSTAGSTGGSTTTGNVVANNTTAVVVKASAGTLLGVQVYGIGSAPAYLKIYNATSATCGSGTPVKRLMIPAASTAANGAGSNITFGDAGVNFGTGITYCVTTGIGDADTTAPAASTFLVNVDYQ